MTIDMSPSMAIFGAIEGEFIVVSGFERVKNYSDQLGLLQVFEGPFSCSTGLLRVYMVVPYGMAWVLVPLG